MRWKGEKECDGRGVSYCVTCDGPLFKNKTVAVIGGGNSGFEAALDLVNYCPKVYILEFGPKVKADEISQERVRKNPKIEVLLNAETKEMKGNVFINSLVYQDRVTGEEKELAVSGIFVEIGSVPVTGFVKDLVELNQFDEIVIDPETCATKTKGLFAAGDVTNERDKQIGVAVGNGIKAALSAYEYLQFSND